MMERTPLGGLDVDEHRPTIRTEAHAGELVVWSIASVVNDARENAIVAEATNKVAVAAVGHGQDGPTAIKRR